MDNSNKDTDIKYPEGVRPDVVNYEDVRKMAPFFDGKKKLVDRVMHWLYIDKVNEVHGRWCYDTGTEFSRHLVEDEFKPKLRVDNEQVLRDFPEGPFVTISNHPYGGFDGITLIYLVGKYRPDYKVMVNMFLNHLSAMRPSFIAVDQQASSDPEKRKVSMQGIREAMKRVREGHPVGFFPAGAISKLNRHMKLADREWQPTVIRLIQQMKVPVIPIFFHGGNSMFSYILGAIDYRLRTLRLPREVFRMRERPMHISVGNPIMPEEYAGYKDLKELGDFLREKTYQLQNIK